MNMGVTSPGVYTVSMAVLLHWKDTHTPATTRGIAKRVGLRSSSAAMRQLDAAWRAGLIDKREGHYWPKNDCVCATCGASHVSESA